MYKPLCPEYIFLPFRGSGGCEGVYTPCNKNKGVFWNHHVSVFLRPSVHVSRHIIYTILVGVEVFIPPVTTLGVKKEKGWKAALQALLSLYRVKVQ